ncbi:MAG: DMT family transporter, partial [Prochlorotrichaceae cyanobacterium]
IDFWRQSDREDEQGQPFATASILSFPGKEWPWLLLSGVALAGDLLLAAWALTQTTVANVTILNNCSPLFARTGAWLLWGKHFDNRFKLGMALALCGAILIGTGDFQIAPTHAFGDLAAILAAFCFSLYLLCIERLRNYLSTIAILWGSSAIAAVFTFLVTAWVEPEWFPLSVQGWLAILGLALISQIVGQGLVTYSLKRISAGAVATTFLLEPVTPAIAAWWLFAEHLSLSNALAFGVVAIGIYLAVSSPSALDTGELAGGIILEPAEVCPIDPRNGLEDRET